MIAQPNSTPCGRPPEGWLVRLSGTRFTSVDHVGSTGSTNADLVARTCDADDGTVLVADHQTAGRGRLGRTWEAPAGANLLASVLLRPSWPDDRHHLVTASLAISVVDALAVLGVSSGVKWPNDLVVEGGLTSGKLAGILAEYTRGPPPAVVVGLGLNLTWPDPGDDGPSGATSLRAHGYQVDRWDLLAGVLAGFNVRLTDLAGADGPALLREEHLVRSATVGRRVRAEASTGDVVGMAVDLTTDGALVIDPSCPGTVRDPVAVSVGDIVHLRPA